MEAYEITLKLTVQYLKDNSPVTVVVAANKWLLFGNDHKHMFNCGFGYK